MVLYFFTNVQNCQLMEMTSEFKKQTFEKPPLEFIYIESVH